MDGFLNRLTDLRSLYHRVARGRKAGLTFLANKLSTFSLFIKLIK